MKNIIFLLVSLMTVGFLTAQKTEGIVIYEQKINLHKKVQEEMRQYVPEFQTSQQELYFSATESLFQDVKGGETHGAGGANWTGDDGENVEIRFEKPENKTYVNFSEKKKVESKDFLGRRFLIEGDIETIPWKITGEMKIINGYQCNKAIFEDEENEQTIAAWFTPTIPSQAGPGTMGQLPGLIMSVNINDGDMVTTAINVELKDVEDGLIVAPTKGKKISPEEFRKVVDAKMKEMGMEGGKGGIKIEIRNN